MTHSRIQITVSILLLALVGTTAAAGTRLSFSNYAIASEASADWTVLMSADRLATNDLLGLFTLKSDPKVKLMAFRRHTVGDKTCAAERSAMNINKVKYETLKTPKGWSCLYVEKEKSRVTAIKSYYIKGKSRSTPYALVIVGESIPKDRFLRAVDALKDVP